MRQCQTSDDRLFAFVDGVETDLESHVATCEDCQEFLAELWIGGLQTDLSEPVLWQIRFDQFLRDVGQLAMDVVTSMGRAVVAFGPGTDDPPFAQGDDEPDAAMLPDTGDDEE